MTIAVYNSSLKSPLMSERLTICIIVCRHAGRISFMSFVGMMFGSQLLFFISIISLCIWLGVSGAIVVNFGTSVHVGPYGGTVLNCSHILLIFSRENVVRFSASSSAVLPGGIELSALFPVSLLMIQKNPLVFFLSSFIWFDMTCFLW